MRPTVIQTAPVNNSKGIDTNLTVKITFSESMNQTTVKLAVSPPVTPGSPTWGANDTELSFKLSNLAQKTEYTVSLTGKDLAGWDLQPYFMKFTTSEHAVLPATVDGTVTDASTSDPIQGASIKAFKSGTTSIINETTTDASGQYAFKLQPGSYDLNISSSGYVPAQMPIVLSEGATETRDIGLYKVGPVTGTVTGTVKDKAGKPIAGATVSTGNTSATTNSKGSYTLTLAPGEYNLSAKAKDYITDYELVTVKARQTTTQDFTLSKASIPPTTGLTMGTMTLLIAIIAIVIVAVIAVLLLMMRKRRKGTGNACAYCQTALPMGAVQCPRCGAQAGDLQSGPQYGPPDEYRPDPSAQGYPPQEYAQEGYPPERPPYG